MKYLLTILILLGLSCMTEAIDRSLDNMLGETALHRTTEAPNRPSTTARGAITSPFDDTRKGEIHTVSIPHPEANSQKAVRPMQASADLTELIARHANGLLFGAILGIMAIIASYAIQKSH